jgi:hypothetical protein
LWATLVWPNIALESLSWNFFFWSRSWKYSATPS